MKYIAHRPASSSGVSITPSGVLQRAGLADDPFTALLKLAVGEDWVHFNDALDTINARIIYNKCGWWEKYITGGNCLLGRDQIKDVLNCYISLAKKKTILEYDLANGSSATTDATDQTVADCAGVVVEQASVVLYELYYATMDRSIPTTRFLRPLTWNTSTDNRQTQPENKPRIPGLGLPWEDLISAVIWTGILAGTVVVGYYGFQFYNDLSAGRRATKRGTDAAD
jgi:hypothetical protein